MNSNKKDEILDLTYLSKEEAIVKKIQKKYAPQEESKVEKLKRLDKEVTRSARNCALIVGIIGCLILGVGICFITVWNYNSSQFFLIGIGLGLVGAIMLIISYPLYSTLAERKKKKLSPAIVKLANEILLEKK